MRSAIKKRAEYFGVDALPSLFSEDGRHVVSANGKKHPLKASKYPNQPLSDRIPYLKKVFARGHLYYYFNVRPAKSRIYSRLPDINSAEFDEEYQRKLSEWDNDKPPTIRRTGLEKIYFMGCETGPVKIGVSSDAERRMAGFQVGCPFQLSILATVVGTRQDEYAYHKRFAAIRLHGEWFERTPELLTEIERLQKEPTP